MFSNKTLEQLSSEAAQEIGENDVNVEEMVENLKRLLEKNYKDLTLPPNREEFLLRFLRGSNFDVSLAANNVSHYFKRLRQLRGIYHHCSASNVSKLFEDGTLTVLKERDSKGRIIILFRQEFLPPTPDYDEIGSATFFYVIDCLHRISVDTQRIGFVIVADMNSFSWSHGRYLKLGLGFAMMKLVTQAFPGRIKGYHVVHNPMFLSYFVTLAKPFLSEEMKSSLHFHGWSMENLHQFIELKCLPEYLGGEVADDQVGDGEILTKLVAEEEYYKDLIKFGYK